MVGFHNLVTSAHVPFRQHQESPSLGADQKARGLWERDCGFHCCQLKLRMSIGVLGALRHRNLFARHLGLIPHDPKSIS